MDPRTEIPEAIESFRQEALALLQTLVHTPSLAGDEKRCQEIQAERMDAMSLEVDMWEPSDEELAAHPAYVPVELSYEGRPNVVGIHRGHGGGPSLILNGHVDVVPTGPDETWSTPPWSGHYENGRVYGRGSADMKGGLVCNLLALQALQAVGISLQGDVIVESVVDEELGGNGTLACILRGYTADACIFTEPSGLGTVAISNRGAQFFRITVPGQEGGVEYWHELVNPIAKAMEVFQAIEAYSIMRESTVSHPLYDRYHDTKVPLGVCRISAGEWPSTVASQCLMEGTIECLPGEDIHKVKEDFKAYLLEWAAKDDWLKDHPLGIQWFGLWFDAAQIEVDHPFVSALTGVIEDVTGGRPAVVGAGGCDLRLPVLHGDTPAVLYGPAGGMIHSTDEYVEFEQVITCAKILALTAANWCGVARSRTASD
jgi:acetylornithine deacetylase